jgi:hypothetical protein
MHFLKCVATESMMYHALSRHEIRVQATHVLIIVAVRDAGKATGGKSFSAITLPVT